MTLADISVIRLFNQQIAKSEHKTASELVSWMCAVQAQDYYMAKWALGVRLPGSTDKLIGLALDKGEIIRTHVLRPTWHFVSPENIHWMLDLTADRIKSVMKSNDKNLGLNESIYTKSNQLIEKALSKGEHLTRDELKDVFINAKINVDENRVAHMLMRAELDKIVCSGNLKGIKQTYALLDEWVPKPKKLSRDEALAKLVTGYFKSHAPATLEDFAWWSGLLINESRKALELVKSQFLSETVSGQTYWFTDSTVVPDLNEPHVYLLPAFDEYLISYKDRSASLPKQNQKNTVSSNGIFYPVIIVGGQVIGLWSRTIQKDKVVVKYQYYQKPTRIIKKIIEGLTIQYALFIGKLLNNQ